MLKSLVLTQLFCYPSSDPSIIRKIEKARLPGFSTISLEPLASEPMLAGSQRIPTMRDYVGYWRPQKQVKQVWGTNISRGCDVASFSFPTLVQETMAEIIQTSK